VARILLIAFGLTICVCDLQSLAQRPSPPTPLPAAGLGEPVREPDDDPELVVPEVAERFADLFASPSFHYTGGVYENERFPYRLFIPVGKHNQKYPIIVWLHGHGEAGSDNVMHLAWLGERMMLPPWRRERFPFFVLCVPCPIENDFWNGYPDGTEPSKRNGSDMISVTDAILDDVLTTFPIDRQRIYLSGVSSGGSGCWEYALKFPNRFAAVAPLAASRVAGDFSRIADVPVWAFHSTHDTGVPVDGARQNVAQLRACGGSVKLTEVDTVSHDCWTAAFQQHGLLAWMLAQRRGSPPVMEIRPWYDRLTGALDGWSWPQIAAQLVVLVIFLAVVRVLWIHFFGSRVGSADSSCGSPSS